MNELTPHQKAALVFDKHVSVTANAGSGKTFVLSKRFVEIFLNTDVDLSAIVAITFTDKAAGELNRKIAKEVEERIQTEEEPDKRLKLENLRRQLVSANISTIHSFCINILKEFAPEAQIDANFNPVDKATSEEIIELSVDETINNLIQDPEYSGDLKYLIRLFSSKNAFVSVLKNSVDKRRILARLENKIYSKSEEEIAREFRELFEKSFNDIFSGRLGKGIELIRQINEFVLRQKDNNETGLGILEQMSEYHKQDTVFGKLLILKKISELMLTKTDGTIRKRGYLASKGDEVEAEVKEVESLYSELHEFLTVDSSGESEKELAKFGKSFLRIFNYTLNLYTEKKKKNGYLDFEDLLIYTERILGINDVKEYLREKYTYIMIDEYQDTNELQYEIFMPILDHLQSGNLFVVGDEKQSIYQFRNAELELFERTKKEILSMKQKGESLNLPHSFRMVPQLVLFTNSLFGNLFRNPDTYFNEVGPSDLVCSKEENEKGTAEIILAESTGDNSESDLVSKRILKLLSDEKDNKLDYKNIAILCRKRNSFAQLEESFVRYGIPFTIIGGKGFFQRQTIYDVFNYLSFLLNTEDDAALVGVLRSPFFNISDLLLYRISLEDGASFFEKLNKLSDPLAKYAYGKLNENLKLSFSMELSPLIRKLLLESGYWAVISAKQNSRQELANIEKLLALARGYSKKSFKNLYDFTVFLREAIEGYEDEGQAQVARDENTVKILTIHQAKGLEYNAVFLYGCNDTTRDDSVKVKSLSIDKNYGLLSKVPLSQKYFEKYSTPPVVALYNYSNERKNRAELKRLLYVGVTRAINFLFITATHKNLTIKPNSFLDLVSKGFQTDFNSAEILLSSDIEFMKLIENEHKFYKKPVLLTIPVLSKIDDVKPDIPEEITRENSKINLTGKIGDIPKREIISATKISMFNQCPVKYQLTYELGYSRIYDMIKKSTMEYEFSAGEEEELKSFGQARGRLIHAALKEEYRGEELRNFISMKIAAEEMGADEKTKMNLSESIVLDLEKFYDSVSYREILSMKNYKSELEIYCQEGEHYLYGIVDRLIIEEDKLVIVDYKTDNIGESQLGSRGDDYMTQLKFYAYIISKLFKDYSKFELRLIFLKYSDSPVSKLIDRADLEEFRAEIENAVEKIYTGSFNKNLNHCLKCHFALEGNKCVKP